MFWVFIILGLASSMLVLHGLAVSVQARRGATPLLWGGAALLLVGVAWATGHSAWMSWVALFAALGIEVVRRRGHSDGRSVESTSESDEASSNPEDATLTQETRAAGGLAEDVPLQLEGHTQDERSGGLPDEREAASEGRETPEELPAESPGPPEDDAPGVPAESAEDRGGETESSADGNTAGSAEPVTPVAELREPTPAEEPPDVSLHTAVQPPESDSGAALLGLPTAAPATPVRRECSLVTMALLQSRSEVVAEVFIASLRRGGERAAELVEGGSGGDAIHLRVGAIELRVESRPVAVSRALLEYATRQSWDWPEAGEAVAGHAGHVVFTSEARAEVAPADVVRLQHQAHAALAEFAPMIAALWPGGGILSPPSALQGLRDLAGGDPSLLTSFVSFRTFPPEEWDGHEFVSDTAGLHAIGLPDFEVATESAPDDRTSAVLYEMAGLAFASPETAAVESAIDLGELGRWRLERGRSRFPPDRDVLVLSPCDEPPKENLES
ncbi:MAG: hypothetical protein ABII12_16120 [Planctomycetota bacterium]